MSDSHKSRSGCGQMLITFGCVFFVVMGALIWMTYSYRSLEEVIRAKGEPVTLAELDAWYTAVPDEENAALVVLQAAGLHKEPLADAPIPFYMKQTRLEDSGTWKLGDPLPDDVKQAIAEFLAANRECLENLGGMDGLSKSRYPVVARTVLGGRMAHLDDIRDLTRILVLDALYKAETGDAASAGASLERAMRLSETLRNEPFLISQMVRVACHSLAVDGIQHVVNRVSLPEEKLKQLQELTEAADDPDTIYRGMIGERCFTTDGSYPTAPNAIVSRLFLSSTARILTQAVDTSRLTGKQRKDEFERIEESANASLNPTAAVFLPAFARTHETHDRDIAKLRVAATVLAIERYRLVENKVRDSLNALVSKFLKAVPVDPFDEQPLRYSKGDIGYMVYSIGTDLRDDQGAEPDTKARNATGDIVIKVKRLQ